MLQMMLKGMVIMDDKFWNCKYHDYDESFDSETGDEWQYPSCTLGEDCDECKNCEKFKEE